MSFFIYGIFSKNNLHTMKKFKKFKKSNATKYAKYSVKPAQTHLQTRITALMPTLMEKITQTEHGVFVFAHPTFPDLRVEGMTLTFMEEHIERAIKRHFRNQPDKHIDYLFALLSK